MNTFEFDYSISQLIEEKKTSIEELLFKDNKMLSVCSSNFQWYHGSLSTKNAEEILQYRQMIERNIFLVLE